MTHKKNKLWFYVFFGIVLVIGVTYIVSSDLSLKDKTTPTDTDEYACPYGEDQEGWCNLPPGFEDATALEDTESELDIDSSYDEPIKETQVEDIDSDYEIVNASHDGLGLVPEKIFLDAGKNYKLIITPSAHGWGCMGTMVIPGIDENVYSIRKGVPINITVDNVKAGTYEVVCGSMGMYQGTIDIQ